VTPLGDSVRRMLADENLKSRIDSDVSLEETFQALVTHALSTLVSGVEARTEVGTGVAKTDWSKVESTGDSSAYVTHAQATFATAVPPVRQTVRDDYFLFFCEKLAGSIAPGAYAAVFRCKKFSDHGAQQLLLDVHALKTLLCELPKAGALGKDEKPRVVPTSYARMVGREMQKVESLVKVILSPREGLAETFRALLPTGSGAEFKKVCELKGMARSAPPRWRSRRRRPNPSSRPPPPPPPPRRVNRLPPITATRLLRRSNTDAPGAAAAAQPAAASAA